MPAFFRLFETRQHGEGAGDVERVRRDVNVLEGAFGQELFVDLDLARNAQVVRNLNDDDSILERFGFLIGDKAGVFVLVGVRNDDLVGIDHRESTGLDRLLLRQRQKSVQELLVAFEHFNEFHETTVGDVQLAVESIRPRIRFDAVLSNRR